uniref:Uncharacterized protein n=1 Tax=Pseudo-nitzschia australis TaxID=44445 RepID=A0A7S4EH27_9STRA|mmetsp:Transcript_19278/g.41914  ORF Transcript_19278/g.41914 Transcript_19278/m.41914 type:complete len:288 (+) Transcript_19278:323-1186(+)|eukprot:CAMPEP_0168176568 /NCGR_PEP_ID=MMETSP0139_2-20121125/7871_1 /TAXON_ID=44445 /ORGANISM="Pseudo-nitzschia australis, Strain 10249 10 AB" /LENGTH=287 /DNA_ID=CAMNT_0008095323 /DNA_START=268 /DNA_END=1131 /DNA_ORIENTATION=+
MISTNNYFHEVSIRPSPQPQALHLTLMESILEINDEGVSLLRAGNNKAAMFRLASCLAVMKSNPVEGDSLVHYKFIQPSRLIQGNITSGMSPSPRYVFGAPIEVVASAKHQGTECSASCCSNHTERRSCKLLSIVLFNLSLAHHLWALEIKERAQHHVKDEMSQNQEVCPILNKALRLYELCHSSLIFTSSGLLCSDLPIAVVVTNNVGEIHKELDYQQEQHERRYHPLKNHPHECSKTALACSEQLVQIFMFFTANGEAERLEDLGDVLSNAMATVNGPRIFAPAA